MSTQTMQIPAGSRYEVALQRRKGEPITWFVVDRTGFLDPRRIGTGAQGVREAVWLARILNGMERDR